MALYNKQQIIKILKEMKLINTTISYEEFEELYDKMGTRNTKTIFCTNFRNK